MTRRLRFVISGSCALLAAALCLLYGRQVREEAERVRTEALERYGGEVVSLVVAPEGIEAGEVVSGRNATERDWLSDLAPEGAVTSLDEVMGTEVTVPAAPGAPLTALNFRDSSDALEVPDGHVALSLPVADDLGLPESVTPGMTLAAYEVGDDGVSLLAPGLVVLRAPSSDGRALGGRGSVSLAALPESVAGVLAASSEGSLRLALPADDAPDLGASELEAPSEVPADEAGEVGQ